MTKILFINPNTRYLNTLLTVYPPQGILYISSILLKENYDVRVIDADIDNLNHSDILSVILEYRPDIIGITMNTLQTKAVYILAEFIKQNTDIPLVVGGPHPSSVKELLLKQCRFIDFLVYGEGEITFLKLVKTIETNGDLSSVDGIIFRSGDSVVINKPRELIANLDEIPFPALQLIGSPKKYPGAYPVGALPSIQVMASRGCPFQCSFCSNPVWGRKTRFRSPESVISEIEWLQREFKVKEIFFVDDTFNLNKSWFESICRGIILKGLNQKSIFKSPFRANKNLVDEDLLKLAKKAGFWMIFYGVESGNQHILDEVNKNIYKNEIERAFKLTKRTGLRTLGSFIIGHLSETRDSVEDTIKFVKKIDPDFFGFAIAMPWPGSEMYTIAKNKGYIIADCEDYVLDRYMLKTHNFSPDELKKLNQYATDSLNRYRNSLFYKIKKGFFGVIFHESRQISTDYVPLQSVPHEYFLDSEIIMGQNDKGALGEGWFSLENWPPFIRWTTRKSVSYLAVKNPKSLHIKLFTRISNQKVTVIANKISKKFEISPDEWIIIDMDINDTHKNVLEVIIKTQTWIPEKLLKTPDNRQLGVAIERIWLN